MIELEDADKKTTLTDKAVGSSDLSRLGPIQAAQHPIQVPYVDIEAIKSKKPSNWRFARLSARILLFGSCISLLGGAYNKGALPSAAEILPEMRRAPEQTSSTRDRFDFTYRKSTYAVTPRAEYNIAGVVVTHNNISGLGDAYHTSDSVDMKDVCVVWGSNILNDNYRNISYTSEPWTCVISSPDSSVWNRFFADELSNNHLMAKDPAVQAKIQAVRVGDQITMRGLLVDYCPLKDPDILRRTSLVRSDTGNGACEVLFVEDLQILKKATPGAYALYTLGVYGIICALLLRLFIFVKAPYGQ